MAQVHTIIRRTIHQYDVSQAVTPGHPRDQVQAGSITFVQRFGSSINCRPRCSSALPLVSVPVRGSVGLTQGLVPKALTLPLHSGLVGWHYGLNLSPLEVLEKLAALVPPPRVHQVRYSGCRAAHSKLRSVAPQLLASRVSRSQRVRRHRHCVFAKTTRFQCDQN
jgi:hypothetical protein